MAVVTGCPIIHIDIGQISDVWAQQGVSLVAQYLPAPAEFVCPAAPVTLHRERTQTVTGRINTIYHAS